MRIKKRGNKNFNVKRAVICGAVILLLFVLIKSGDKNNYAFYMKDKQLFCALTAKQKSLQIAEKIVTLKNKDKEELKAATNLFQTSVKQSKDGQILFYLDEVDNSSGASLYYKNIDEKGQAKKIASGVQEYKINDEGNSVTYLVLQGAELYRNNLKKEEKIATQVQKFFASEDGQNIVYQTTDGDIFIQKGQEEQKKVADNVTSIQTVSKDAETIYYLKGTTLYKKVWGKKEVLIAKEVQTVINVYDSGEIYYLRQQPKSVTWLDYIEDDKKVHDEEVGETDVFISPFRWEYDSEDEYLKAYTEYLKFCEEHREKYNEYNEKLKRDSLRSELPEIAQNVGDYELCYYNGKGTIIAENLHEWKTYAKEEEAVIYSAVDTKQIEKTKLSEMTSVSEGRQKLQEMIEASISYYLVVGNKVSKIEQQHMQEFDIDNQAKNIYMIANVSELKNGELYRAKVSNGKIGKPQKIDEQVHIYNANFNGDTYIYYKDVNIQNNIGTLYVDGEKVDSNVRIGSVNCNDGTVAYLMEWNPSKWSGQLKVYRKNKIRRVYDGAYDYVLLDNGQMAYLCNYDKEKYKGELYIYKGNKSKKVDEDVVALIRINTSK